jgi:hypothetical protein
VHIILIYSSPNNQITPETNETCEPVVFFSLAYCNFVSTIEINVLNFTLRNPVSSHKRFPVTKQILCVLIFKLRFTSPLLLSTIANVSLDEEPNVQDFYVCCGQDNM